MNNRETETFTSAKQIFVQASKIADPGERAIFLNSVCAENAHCRHEVEQLLAAAQSQLTNPLDRVGNVLGVTEEFDAEGISRANDPTPLPAIGPYQLLEQIGEGGMGVVYVARQEKPIRRTVALKLIKPGMDSKQVIARFESERQALAMMSHPNIAKVLDAGTTTAGLPYFVMELVKGIPITEYCDQQKLDIQHRLRLFVEVCEAVQHAHQKGIIHRDLKPSNILIEFDDSKAMPVVIDFGVAKAVHQDTTNNTIYTATSQMIGTPLYMSPEQSQMNSLEVDTRSDVYSLGVVLYELLTGSTPFDRELLKRVGLDEMRRIIREDEPPRPSSRISTLSSRMASTVSERRQTDLRRLSMTMRSELDWVVMRSLEKDRSRRYDSASALAADLRRYLNGDAVEACPPSAMYRFRKIGRRYRDLSVAAGVLAMVLVVTAALSLLLLARERELAANRQYIQREINTALTAAARLRGRSDSDLLDDRALVQANEQIQLAKKLADAGNEATDEQTRLQIYRIADELQQEQKDRDFMVAFEIAKQAQAVGERSDLIPILREAFAAYGLPVEQGPADSFANELASRPTLIREQLLAALEDWRTTLRPPYGITLTENGNGQVGVAYAIDEVRERIKPGSLLLGIAQGREGAIVDTRNMSLLEIQPFWRSGLGSGLRLELQEPGTKQSRIEAVLPHPTSDWIRNVVETVDPDPWRRRLRDAAELLQHEVKWEALMKLHEDVDLERQPPFVLLRLQSAWGHPPPVHDAPRKLMMLLQQKYPDDFWVNYYLGALFNCSQPPDRLEALRFYTAAKALRPDSASVRLNLGALLNELGKPEESLAESRDALRLRPGWASAYVNLGSAYHKLGRNEEAMQATREAVRIDPNSASARANLGGLLIDSNAGESMALLREAISLHHEELDLHDQRGVTWSKEFQANAYHLLGSALKKQGLLDEAVAAYRESLTILPNSSEYHRSLGQALLQNRGTYVEAAAEFREALRLQPDNAAAHANLAELHFKQGEVDKAIEAFQEAIRLKPTDARSRTNLGALLTSKGKFDEALLQHREAIQIRPDLALAHVNLGKTLLSQNKLDEASAALSRAIELQPDHGEAQYIRGTIYFDQHKFSEAAQAFEQAIRLNFSPVDSYIRLAQTLERQGKWDDGQGKWDEASKMLRKSLKTQPEDKNARSLLGQISTNQAWKLANNSDLSKRDLKKSLALAREALELNPRSGNNMNNFGVALLRNSHWQESVDALEKADAMIEGGDRDHRIFLAMAHWQLGNHEVARQRYAEGAAWIFLMNKSSLIRFRDEAEELLGISPADRERLIEAYYAKIDTDDPKQRCIRGQWHIARGEHHRALEDLDAALSLEPDSKDTLLWRSRGAAYAGLSRHDEALASFSHALTLSPNDVKSLVLRSKVHLELEQLDEALADINEAIRSEPANSSQYLDRAYIYRNRGEFALALADVENCLQRSIASDSPPIQRAKAYALRGDIYTNDQQQYQRAVDQYGEAIELEPSNADYLAKREAVRSKLAVSGEVQAD